MSYEITKKFAEIMITGDETLPERLGEKENELNELKCNELEYGKWIEEWELPVLIEILSDDDYFFERFPGLRAFTRDKRLEFIRDLERHVESCGRCSLKIQQNAEWAEELEAFAEENGEILRAAFQ
jgi:hypothetical protein